MPYLLFFFWSFIAIILGNMYCPVRLFLLILYIKVLLLLKQVF